MASIMSGLNGVDGILDDLIVTGSNDEEHFKIGEHPEASSQHGCEVEAVEVCVYEAFSGVFRVCG